MSLPRQRPTGPDAAFWRGRRVLLTGHTGFKGGWAALWLRDLGAEVTGFALPPETEPSLFAMLGDAAGRSILGDLRDPAAVTDAVVRARPEIVLHMAAQPLVRRSYLEPAETFAVNVMARSTCLTRCAGPRGCAAPSWSPPTKPARTTSRAAPSPRTTGWAGTTLTPPPRRRRRSRSRASRAPASSACRWRRRGAATSSAAAISRPTGWCRTSSVPRWPAGPSACATLGRRGPGSTCSTASPVTSSTSRHWRAAGPCPRR